VNEEDFWVRLEFRISGEFARFADRALRGNWCDGLIPEVYDLAGSSPLVRGRAYAGRSGQERWTFELLLGEHTAGATTEIDWAALVPADDVTGWLTPHLERRHLKIDPGSAVPD
jgi:hypothetical protein